jgi:hypothetical protein
VRPYRIRNPRRAAWRGAALLAVALAACTGERIAEIPVGRSDDELVVVTRQLETAFVSSTVKSATRSRKDDLATGWDHRLEEQVDPVRGGVSQRRFRITLANRSEKARTIRVELDYLDPASRGLLRRRTFRTVVMPPFTEKAISGFTKFRADRAVIAELRATEVEPEE